MTVRRLALLTLVLWACGDGPVSQPPATTSLAVDLTVPAASAAADRVTIRLEGPSPKTRTASPGESVTFSNLETGSYVVSVEGMLGGDLEWFDETTVSVTAGNASQARLTARSFQPGNLNVATTQLRVGESVQLTWSGVSRAASYRVEWDGSATFGSPQSTTVSAASYNFTATTTGTVFFRVRAVNRFNSASAPSGVEGPVNVEKETYRLEVTSEHGFVSSDPAGIDCGSDCSEDYPAGVAVDLAPGITLYPYGFMEWRGDCSGSDAEACSVTMDQNRDVTAVWGIVVPVSVEGEGTVTSGVPGIDCGNTCSAVFEAGTTVDFVAQPAPGWVFDGWAGNCSGTGPCSVLVEVEMLGDALLNPSVGATFVPEADGYTLSVSTSGQGTITSFPAGIDCGTDCSETYDEGTAVTLTAAPAAGWQISSWGGACATAAGGTTCQVDMTADRQASVTFVQTPRTLSVSKSGSGSVTSTPAGISIPTGGVSDTGTFQDGSSVTLTAIPANGWQVAGWGGDCAGAGTSTTCQLTMSADRTASVSFQQQQPTDFTLDVTRLGDGFGTITSTPAGIDIPSFTGSDSGVFPSGTDVTLTVTFGPTEVSAVQSWGGACAGAGTSNTCQVQMSSDRQVSVTLQGYTYLQLSHQGSLPIRGSVTSSPAGVDLTKGVPSWYGGPFPIGSTLVLTAQPDPGYEVAFWTAPCTEPGVGNTCTFVVPDPLSLGGDRISGPSYTVGWQVQAPSAPAAPSETARSSWWTQLGWSSVSGATSFDVYRNDPGFGFFPVAQGLAATSWTDTNVNPGESHAYAVAACNSTGCSPLSATGFAGTDAGSDGIPVLQSPADGAQRSVAIGSVDFYWGVVPDSDGHQLELCDASSVCNQYYAHPGNGGYLSFPVPLGSYTWRVRAQTPDGYYGRWSVSHALTIY